MLLDFKDLMIMFLMNFQKSQKNELLITRSKLKNRKKKWKT